MKKATKWNYLLPILISIVSILDIIASWVYFSDPYFKELSLFNHLCASIYLTLKLFTMSVSVNEAIVPVLLNVLRFISPLLLASVFLKYFFTTTKKYWTYLNVKLFFKKHIIFCGLSDIAIILINDYLKKDKDCKIIVIENDETLILNQLFNKKHVKLINGNALDFSILKKSKIFKAKTVFTLNDNEKYNISIANEIQDLYIKYPRKNKNLLNVIINISDFYNIRIFKNFQEKKIPNLDFHAFNIYQKAAAFIVDKYSPDLYIPISDSNDFSPNILVHGMDLFGECIIVESAHLYHFANLKKTKITVIDFDISTKKQLFLKKYPFIAEVVEIEFYEENEFFDSILKSLDNISVCFICDRNDSESVLTARKYRQMFFNKNLKNNNEKKEKNAKLLSEPIIVINLNKAPDILNLFKNVTSTTKSLNIEIENIFDNVCTKKLLADDHEEVDDIAKQFHNIYMKLDSKELETNWEGLTDEGKDFNRYPARHIAIKLRYLGAELVDIKLEKPDFEYDKISKEQKDTLARMEHERWNAEKLLTGFVPGKVGLERDFYKLLKENLKWHKDIRLWEELTIEDQEKDEMLNELKEITSKLKYRKTVKFTQQSQ